MRRSAAAPAPTPAEADAYYPENGDLSYDVRHYDLHLGYQPSGNQLRGRAVIDAVALTDVDELHLDLHRLRVTRVECDGPGVKRFAVRRGKLVVRTEEPLGRGDRFRLTVDYQGKPSPIRDGDDGAGWEELADGVIVAGQPTGAPSWFPCNDRPSNKAAYTVTLTAPSAYHVVVNGTLMQRRRGAGSTTWTYRQSEPMATYLATVQIGRYTALEVQGSPVPLRAYLPPRLRSRYASAFGRQPEMLALFSRLFGPYPFAEYAVVVTDDALEIPLEAQGLSVFGSNFLREDWDAVRLVAHEMSHQWFGNSLTLTTWRDIWLHEGFACYSEWLWSQESGSRSTHERAVEHWARLARQPQDLVLADPGRADMFDDRVYKRGALTLHALRLTVGEEAFFGLLRTWVQRHSLGSVTTTQLIDLAAEVLGAHTGPLLRQWLFERRLPALPAVR